MLRIFSLQATPPQPVPSAVPATKSPTVTTHRHTLASPVPLPTVAPTPWLKNPPPCPLTVSPANSPRQMLRSPAPYLAYLPPTASPPYLVLIPTNPRTSHKAAITITAQTQPATTTLPSRTSVLGPTLPTAPRSTRSTKPRIRSARCREATPITAAVRACPVLRSRTYLLYRQARTSRRPRQA